MNRIKGSLGEGKTSQHICFKDSSMLPSKYHLLSRTTSLKLKIGKETKTTANEEQSHDGPTPFLTWPVHVFKYV